MVAGTLVVHAPRLRASPQSPVAGVHAPVQPLRPEEPVAVIAFAERAAQLTPERQEALADIAEPATGARGETGVMRLLGLPTRPEERRARQECVSPCRSRGAQAH